MHLPSIVLFTLRVSRREPHADVCIFTDARGFYLPWNGTPRLRDYVIVKYNPPLNVSPPPRSTPFPLGQTYVILSEGN